MYFYIAPEDVGKYYSVNVNLTNWDRNAFPSILSPFTITILDNWVATTSGTFHAYRDTELQSGGYKLEGSMKRSYLSGWVVNPFGYFDNKYSIFVIGEDTYLSSLAHAFDNINTAFGNFTATTTEGMSGFCVPWSGSFDTIGCLGFMFIPDQELITETLTNFRENALNRFPLGYANDFVNILSTTTTRSLNVISGTLPTGIAGAGSSINLDLTNSLDYVLNATTSQFTNSSASSTETLFTITNRYWSWVVYFFTVMYLLSRILGSRIIPNINEHLYLGKRKGKG